MIKDIRLVMSFNKARKLLTNQCQIRLNTELPHSIRYCGCVAAPNP